ncbi:MAG: 4-hydroxythreonine-4-phosphate dehydrogenase PdxA [Candidatus Omnitrophota bacterium]
MPISPSSKPLVALTMGDPSGIGAEIILQALAKPAIKKIADYIVVGDLRVLEKANHILQRRGMPSIFKPASINVLDLQNVRMGGFSFGKERADYGRASIEYIREAFRLVRSGAADSLVTAPINKSSAKKSGFKFPGHTEYLAALSGAKDYVMMLAGGPLRVSLVTRHVRLKKVSRILTSPGIERTINITLKALKDDLGISNPRVGVCALNPHASDGGIFGDEEKKIISPAVNKFRRQGVSGPYPADALFYDAYHGRFDCVICLYHDQGLIPLKMIARDRGVNITLGLGFVRTSPDHGTAFDIAGKGKADPRSMEMAIKMAVDMAVNRKRYAFKKRN